MAVTQLEDSMDDRRSSSPSPPVNQQRSRSPLKETRARSPQKEILPSSRSPQKEILSSSPPGIPNSKSDSAIVSF